MGFQIFLIVVISILTVTIVTVGIYLVLALHDLRDTLKRSNQVIDNLTTATNILTNPMSLFTEGLNLALELIRSRTRLKKDKCEYD